MSISIGIAIGDVTGVGPEVSLKALAAFLPQTNSRFLLIGDHGVIARHNEKLGLNLPLTQFESAGPSDRIAVIDPMQTPLPPSLPSGSPEAALAAIASLKAGAVLALSDQIQALVTAPVNKASIIRADVAFVGQTELLSELAGTSDTVMMLLGHDERLRWLRVALVTTHLSLRAVPDAISEERIERTVRRASEACHALALERSRIGVCGLNPHAGEEGEMGREEIELIEPVIERLKERYDVSGPWPADTLFHAALEGRYDVVVAMYHDQGLAPLKMLAFDTGVNWTLGLPFIRTSPDHGTAYDIAGKGIARPLSMLSAIRLAEQLAKRAKS